MTEQSQLRLEIIWKDEEIVEVQAKASNGRYCGTTEVYTTSKDLINLANKIDGFPKQVTDVVEFQAGEQGSYAFLSLRFYCIDGSGHTAIQIHMEENVPTNYRPEEKHKVILELPYETGAIDRFQRDLLRMANDEHGYACL